MGWLYHMRPNCFYFYRDLRRLIECMLQDFKLYASNIVYPLSNFMYISLSNYPYRYTIHTSINHISKISINTKLIKNLSVRLTPN